MWTCFRNCFAERIGGLLLVATVLAIVAGIIGAFGGITIVIGGVTLPVVITGILAALLVFGLVVALAAVTCLLNCLMNAQPADNSGVAAPSPRTDRDPLPDLHSPNVRVRDDD